MALILVGNTKTRRPADHQPGKLIVRFKPAAVEAAARTPVAARAGARMLAAALPSQIAGPITYLREVAGVRSMKPMFVGSPTRAERAGEGSLRSLASLHGSLSRSATQAPRESLSGFQMVEISATKDQAAVLKLLRAAKAVDFAEPVPNHWLTAQTAPIRSATVNGVCAPFAGLTRSGRTPSTSTLPFWIVVSMKVTRTWRMRSRTIIAGQTRRATSWDMARMSPASSQPP
jgi:hypothetical protein